MVYKLTWHHAQAHFTVCALVDRHLSLATWWTKATVELGEFRWPVLVMLALEPHSICCCHAWSSNQTGGGVILTFSSFFNQIPHQKKSEISVGIFTPHMKITESNCWVLLDPENGKTVSWSTWSYIDSSNSCWPYNLNCQWNPCAGYTIPQCGA